MSPIIVYLRKWIKVRDKNANEVDLSDEEEDLLAKELAEAERRKVEKKKK